MKSSIINSKVARLLIVQRVSLSHSTHMSRSIGARFGPLLNYMKRHELIEWYEKSESEIKLTDIKHFNAILLNKHTSKKGIELIEMAKNIGVQTIYDLDDWILDLPSYSVTTIGDDIIANIIEMLRLSDIVTVSNKILKNKLKFIRNDVVVLKNGFDHYDFPIEPLNYKEAIIPKILFSNTDGIKLVNFKKQFIDQLIVFLNQYPDVQLDFWGDKFPEVKQIPRVVQRGFVPNKSYKHSIMEEGYWFAIVPLGGAEDPEHLFFNSCKSCIKYIDYGSLCIPGIYSNTPVYADVIKSRINGILINNEGDNWYNSMVELYGDFKLRQLIRDNAYKDCVEKFGLENSAKIIMNILYGIR